MAINECVVLDNYMHWKIAKRIFCLENKENRTISSLANEIETSNTSPYFYNVLRFLIENKAITFKEYIGNSKVLTINHKKMKELVEDSEVWDELLDYVENKHSFWGFWKI